MIDYEGHLQSELGSELFIIGEVDNIFFVH